MRLKEMNDQLDEANTLLQGKQAELQACVLNAVLGCMIRRGTRIVC